MQTGSYSPAHLDQSAFQAHQIQLHSYPYADDISDDVDRADLIISHAGKSPPF